MFSIPKTTILTQQRALTDFVFTFFLKQSVLIPTTQLVKTGTGCSGAKQITSQYRGLKGVSCVAGLFSKTILS
jgi:hypothetical protein